MRSRDDEDQGRRDWRSGDEQQHAENRGGQQQQGSHGSRGDRGDYGSGRQMGSPQGYGSRGGGQHEQFSQPGPQYGGHGGAYGADSAWTRGAGNPDYPGSQGTGGQYGYDQDRGGYGNEQGWSGARQGYQGNQRYGGYASEDRGWEQQMSPWGSGQQYGGQAGQYGGGQYGGQSGQFRGQWGQPGPQGGG